MDNKFPEFTIAIIKPDVAGTSVADEILAIIYRQPHKYKIRALEWVRLPPTAWERFYVDLQDRPFFRDLAVFMASDAVCVLVLEGDNAVQNWRNDIGATDPKKADPTTIRGLFGDKAGPMMRNAVHGSATKEDAVKELGKLRSWMPAVFAPRVLTR